MNREMLLESNNIHFESKLRNIRQMASKLFSLSEEPFVDDFPQDGVEVNNINILNDDDEKNDHSWRDVEKIFETFNKQIDTPQILNQNQQQKLLNERKDGHSHRKLIKDQNNELHHRKDKATTPKIYTSETVHNVESGEMNANKENIRESIDQRTSADLAPPHQLQNSNCSVQESRFKIKPIQSQNINSSSSSVQAVPSKPVPTIFDSSKQASSLYDQSNRVRQVNVEMFTVTLKRTDPPKDKSVCENG